MQQPHGVLAARNIAKSYGDTVVLENLSVTITPASRIGIVGPNGIGKSTLLRLLAEAEEPDSGVVSRKPPELSVAYLAQQRQAAGLSGGEAARRKLEAILATQADVLLLDEPTNDLDFAALEQLERFLDRHRGGLAVVSHDRAFLEGMTSILEFEAETRRVREYHGGWQQFEEQRAAARARHESAYATYAVERKRVEQQVQRMRRWEERGYGQGRKKKKTKDVKKSGERKLARVERVEKPWTPWQLKFGFANSEGGSGGGVARLERATVDRNGFRLGPIDLELRSGDRLALLGRNGSGKTTLLKALLGELPLASGRRSVGPGVVMGELPQGPSVFAGNERLLESFVAQAGLAVNTARALLAKFALGTDHVLRPVRSLSPGERSRATIALLVARGVNTLVLDEPTNNLDLEAIEQLELALADFQGTVALVTHDRRFLAAFAATQTIEL